MNFISKEALQRIREGYTEGTKVELTSMSALIVPTSFPAAKARLQGWMMQARFTFVGTSALLSQWYMERMLAKSLM